jgi:ribonuclease HI
MAYTNATNLVSSQIEWLSTLEFYEKDLEILKKRLTEIINKNTHTEARSGAEHFQNQFIVQKNNIDELKHIIGEHAHLIYEDAKQHAGHVENKLAGKHKEIDAEIKDVEKILIELRQEFNRYASKWI